MAIKAFMERLRARGSVRIQRDPVLVWVEEIRDDPDIRVRPQDSPDSVWVDRGALEDCK